MVDAVHFTNVTPLYIQYIVSIYIYIMIYVCSYTLQKDPNVTEKAMVLIAG